MVGPSGYTTNDTRRLVWAIRWVPRLRLCGWMGVELDVCAYDGYGDRRCVADTLQSRELVHSHTGQQFVHRDLARIPKIFRKDKWESLTTIAVPGDLEIVVAEPIREFYRWRR